MCMYVGCACKVQIPSCDGLVVLRFPCGLKEVVGLVSTLWKEEGRFIFLLI